MSKRKKPQHRSPAPKRPGAIEHQERLLYALEELAVNMTRSGHPRTILAELGEQRRLTQEAIDVSILLARRRGMPWSDIGALLGVSPQAAEQRLSRLGSTFVDRFLVERAA